MKQNKWEKLFDEFMGLTEFSLIKYGEDNFGVRDHQEANLGNIEADRFDDAALILDRMEIYEDDYIVTDICECLDNMDVEYDYDTWSDLLQYRDQLPDNDFEFDILDMICNHFDEINLNNCTYEEEN